MSLGTSQRCVNGFSVWGDMSKTCVQQSNVLLARAALLCILCASRSVFWCVEQPGTSKLPKIDYFHEMLQDSHVTTYFVRLPESQIASMTGCWLPICLKKMLNFYPLLSMDALLTKLDGLIWPYLGETVYAVWNLVALPSLAFIFPNSMNGSKYDA